MRRQLVVSFVLVVVLLLAGLSVGAQSGGEVIVDGLSNPRGLFYAEDGTLYVAEAGTGGSGMGMGPMGNEVAIGGTGQITAVSPDGDVSVAVPGLASMDGGNIFGTQAVAMADGILWIVQGEGPHDVPFNMALIGLDAETHRVVHFVDLYTPELELNPDGDIVASQPTDLAFGPDGAIYISNAGCNCIMRWAEGEDVTIAASWTIEDNPVPTTLEFDANGDLYVGFLTGFPFPAEGSRIEQWSGGELVQTYEGLTAVVGLLVDDMGTIYAVEFGQFGDAGWEAGSGRVVMVSADGITPVAEGLDTPYGIAQAPDGSLAVVVNSSGAPGTGQVISVGGM